MPSPEDATPLPREQAVAKVGRRKKLIPAWKLLGFGLSVLAFTGLFWPVIWGEAGVDSSTAAASDGSKRKIGSVPRVETVKPARGGVRRLTMQPGSVHSFESVDLYAKVSGFLKVQSVDIGSAIKRGDMLAEIDVPELQAQVSEAEAAVEQAQARADQAESRVSTAEAEREAADAAVIQADSDIARLAARSLLAHKQYERIKDLYSRNAIDGRLVDEHQQEMDAAEAAKTTGHAAVATARARASTAAARVLEARADVTEARAAFVLAKARLERIKVLAGYTKIVAPFDGVITRRNYHPGAFIRSAADGSSTPLLTATRTDLMRVVIQVPDLDVPLLDVGDKVALLVDALKSKEFAGSISRLGKSEDSTTRTMRVEVDIPNPDGLLVEGMYGRATIELQPPTGNLTVPAACVVNHTGRGQASVFVFREGKARRIPVTLGGDDGTSVEILSGLDFSDEVILRPASSLDDGTPVQVSMHRSEDSFRLSSKKKLPGPSRF